MGETFHPKTHTIIYKNKNIANELSSYVSTGRKPAPVPPRGGVGSFTKYREDPPSRL